MAKQRYTDANHVAKAARMRAWHAANKEKANAWAARYRAEHVEELREYERSRPSHGATFTRNHPERDRIARRARDRLRAAIKRGELVRPDVPECGHAGKVEAAHYNYDEPLRVRWLCRSCHVRWDAASPKT